MATDRGAGRISSAVRLRERRKPRRRREGKRIPPRMAAARGCQTIAVDVIDAGRVRRAAPNSASTATRLGAARAFGGRDWCNPPPLGTPAAGGGGHVVGLARWRALATISISLLAPVGRASGFSSLSEASRHVRDVSPTRWQSLSSSVEPSVQAELANADDRWHPSWFPITAPEFPIVVDCSVAPIGEHDSRLTVHRSQLTALKALLGRGRDHSARWSAGGSKRCDCGAWSWDQSRSHWIVDRDRLPPELRTHPFL